MHHDPADLFASAAPYYARHRPGYDPRLYALLRVRRILHPAATVLDLGAGTGEIALTIAGDVAHVHAVDPEPGMLAEGRRTGAERGITNITWTVGDSTTLSDLNLPPIHVVTIGKAFHWMNRAQTLAELDRIMTPDGTLLIVWDGYSDQRPRDPWEAIAANVRAQYLGPTRRADTTTYQHPEEGHEQVLTRSPFTDVEIRRWDRTIPRTLDDLIGLTFSFSFSTPALFGDRVNDYEADLRAALVAHQPDGQFTETIRTEAIIATRS
ncbi:class I SAM-dependent methyltransferase (plasmid) [Streptomyces sp. NBC_01724]|uniref:class I SAM-dependent methyltransferase n=1 Tax=Streptomyces sp. NBC_01724 TaxID=2975922 RepID=UPI002E30C852|nr:class I SAM-dependent methyltransferase [Streptomyces sp. NBC_01724]